MHYNTNISSKYCSQKLAAFLIQIPRSAPVSPDWQRITHQHYSLSSVLMLLPDLPTVFPEKYPIIIPRVPDDSQPAPGSVIVEFSLVPEQGDVDR